MEIIRINMRGQTHLDPTDDLTHQRQVFLD
jgi:hypothetical protein